MFDIYAVTSCNGKKLISLTMKILANVHGPRSFVLRTISLEQIFQREKTYNQEKRTQNQITK
jgi:hypothetical protein